MESLLARSVGSESDRSEYYASMTLVVLRKLAKDLGIIAALAEDADLRLPLVEQMRALVTEMRTR